MDVDRRRGKPGSQQRGRLGRRAAQAGEQERTLAAGIVGACSGGIVVVIDARTVVVLAADFLAQIGRVGGNRHQRIHAAERGRQPRQRIRRKAALEHLRRSAGARRRRWCSQHHRDEPLVAAGRGRHDIEAGGADEAGFHSVGARIGIEQPVGVAHDALAEPDRPDMPVAVIFREFADQGPRQNGEIAGRRDLFVGGQAVGIDIARLGHAQALRIGIHFAGEFLDGAGNAFGQHHRHVVGRVHQHHLQGVVHGDLGADLEAHLGGLLGCRIRPVGEYGIEGNALLAHRPKGHIGGHQLGDGGRIPRIGGVLALQDLAGVDVDEQARLGPGLARMKPGCDQDNGCQGDESFLHSCHDIRSNVSYSGGGNSNF